MKIMLAALILAATGVCDATGVTCGDLVPDASRFQCAIGEKARSEQGLNSAYSRVTEKYRDNPQDLENLNRAQRGWVAYRDNHCEMSARQQPNPSETAFEFDTCIAGHNRTRMFELKYIAEPLGL